jgi:hypothetical protein
VNKTADQDNPPYAFPNAPVAELRQAVFRSSRKRKNREMMTVVVIERRKRRRIVNIEEIASAIREVLHDATVTVRDSYLNSYLLDFSGSAQFPVFFVCFRCPGQLPLLSFEFPSPSRPVGPSGK